MCVIRRHFLVWAPTVSLFRWLLFVDHVDLAAPRAQMRWTRARPRKVTTRSRGRRDCGCPRVEEYEGSVVRCSVRLPSLENDRRSG